jgi:hypothetical protein
LKEGDWNRWWHATETGQQKQDNRKKTEDGADNYKYVLLCYAVIKPQGVVPQWRDTAHAKVPVTWKYFHKAATRSQFCFSLRLKEVLFVTGD